MKSVNIIVLILAVTMIASVSGAVVAAKGGKLVKKSGDKRKLWEMPAMICKPAAAAVNRVITKITSCKAKAIEKHGAKAVKIAIKKDAKKSAKRALKKVSKAAKKSAKRALKKATKAGKKSSKRALKKATKAGKKSAKRALKKATKAGKKSSKRALKKATKAGKKAKIVRRLEKAIDHKSKFASKITKLMMEHIGCPTNRRLWSVGGVLTSAYDEAKAVGSKIVDVACDAIKKKCKPACGKVIKWIEKKASKYDIPKNCADKYLGYVCKETCKEVCGSPKAKKADKKALRRMHTKKSVKKAKILKKEDEDSSKEEGR